MTMVDITPSPRVLRMLGQINFAPWQCLAELIDNSIDSYLEAQEAGGLVANPRINISLPSENDIRAGNGALIVKDNGPGMTLEQLQKAVKAGYSGNDPVEKMGLFGMGFNIATARLGRCTEVRTTTAEASQWVSVLIDFNLMEREQRFEAPVRYVDKSENEIENSVHGTQVCITRVEPERIRPLTRGGGKAFTRRKLGKIYGHIMKELNIHIVYDGDLIKPWRHCTWNPRRTVPTAEFGNVPTRIEIDETLPAAKYCNTCWVWLNTEEEECPACGGTDAIVDRLKRLKGWIGVQRYFDKEHYGIDLIRNGRVIEELDKSFFYFNSNDGEQMFEYPIDAVHWGGRIVGELEINFVRVSHQKDKFDKLDPEWQHVVELVRGISPLRPRIAEQLGLPRNNSPLARLYSGYRAGHVGLKELVPGDSRGKGLNTGPVKEYVERFYNDEVEYQDDEKWYQLVLQADRALRGEGPGGEEVGGDPPVETETEEGEKGGDEEISEVVSEYRVEKDHELSRAYELNFAQGPINVVAEVNQADKLPSGKPFEVEASGYSFRMSYVPTHSLFENTLATPLDYLLIDIAHHFIALAAETPRNYPVSLIADDLRRKYFPDYMPEISSVSDSAEAFLIELRNYIDETLPREAPLELTVVDPATLAQIRRCALQSDLANEKDVNDAIRNGKFVKYVDNSFLLKLIEKKPQLVMDGKFFSNPYTELSDDLRPEAVVMLCSGLEDIRWLAEEGSSSTVKDLAWRLTFRKAVSSFNLVQHWRS